MERAQARDYFKNKGLSYAVLTEEDIKLLGIMLAEELFSYLMNGGNHARQMSMKVSTFRKKDVKVLKKTGLKYARIQIDGSYFKRREGITFSQTGFIGFGCEFSDVNVQPILKAFCKWCDYIVANGALEEGAHDESYNY